MKVLSSFILVLLLFGASLSSCEEVEEEGKYSNWRSRNEAFIDSIRVLAGDNYVYTEEAALNVPENQLFLIRVSSTSFHGNPQYVYCKKIKANTQGERPLFTQSVSVFCYATIITGEKYQGNFSGYSALDKEFSEKKEPTPFDSPVTYAVYNNTTPVLPAAWTSAIQYMRTGERWIWYIPWESAYGSSDYGNLLGYSALTYDVILEAVVK